MPLSAKPWPGLTDRKEFPPMFTCTLRRPRHTLRAQLGWVPLRWRGTLEERLVPAAFTPGNLVVCRVGTGSGSLINTGNEVFVDEYTTAGALVQSIAMPSTGGGPKLIASGTASSEGLLSLSGDGKYLALAGYNSVTGGGSNLTTSASATINRTVGRIDAAGAATFFLLSDAADGGNIRSAMTPNGVDFWVTGSTGGVRYTTAASAPLSTQLSTTATNLRGVNTFGGQLYVSSLTGSLRMSTVGSGMPTTSGQTITNLPGFLTSSSSPYQFFFADLSPGVAGVDTLYVAEDATGGGQIQKWSLVAGTWTARGTVAATGIRGLTGYVNNGTVVLYGATGGSGASGGGTLYSFSDTTGYNNSITGTATSLATAATNTAFRGVAFVPTSAGPTVSSITRSAYSPTNASSVTYTVTFSQPVANVNANDFTLTTTVSGAAVTDVTGSGTTYTVTVNTGTGDGTLRLDVSDDDSIVNYGGQALGGIGAGNGSFTAGEAYTLIRALVADDAFYTGGSTARGEYTVGILGGQNPTSLGWNGVWTTSTGNQSVSASGLNATDIATAGGRVEVSDNSRVGRAFSSTYNDASNTTVYLRFLLNFPADNPTAYRAFELHNGGNADGNRVLQLGQNSSDFGNGNLGLRLFNSNSFRLDLGAVNPGATEVMVIKFVFGSTPNADTVTVWRNPATSASEPGGGQTLTNFNLSFDRLNLANFSSGAAWGADEIRIGTTWSSVGPVDTTPPSVSSITRVNASPTNAASVQYTVTFSEPVTGVDAGDFALTVSGLTGTSVAGVSGSGTTYTVTVNTGSGDGTLRIDVADDDTIGDAAGNKLGGTGAGNGNFASGEVYAVDLIAPTVMLASGAPDPTNVSITVSVTFSEPVAGFDAGDLTLTNASVSDFTGSGAAYSFTLTAGGQGLFSVAVPAASATDAVGNDNTASNTLSRTFDSVAPSVTAISRTGASPTNAASVQFSVTFSEAVTGVDVADFVAAAVGVTGAFVSAVTGSGDTYTVTVNSGSGDGTLRLDLTDDDSITDAAGNALGGTGAGNGDFAGETYALDRTAPAVTSVVRAGANPTNADDVQFTVTFSEAVSGLDINDFAVSASGPTGTSVTNVTGSGDTYTVTVNTGTGDGTLRLDVIDNDSITDPTGNALGGAGAGNGDFTASELYDLDRTNPTVTLASADPDPTNTAITVTVTFSEPVIGFDAGDVTVTNAAVSGFAGSGAVYTFTLTPLGQGLFTAVVPVSSAADPAGNDSLVSNTLSGTFDTIAPAAFSITRADANPTGAQSVSFTVSFTEPVTGVGVGDFVIDATGVVGASVTGVSGSGANYTVTVDTGTGDGTLSIDFDANAAGGVTDAAGNASVADFTGGEVYTITRTFPSVLLLVRADADPTNASSVTFTVTFDANVTGVDATDFALTTAGLSGVAVTGVSGSGTTYTVAVSTGTGSGTIRLDVADDDSITDGSGNKLGGDGAGNGDFTAGEVYTIDRTPPALAKIDHSKASDASAGKGGFWLDLTFSEPMDPAFAPAVSFPAENPFPTLVFADGSWLSATVFRALYDVTDYNIALADIDVRVTGGRDVAGNLHGTTDTADVFSIDMQNPVVVSIYRDGASPTNGNSAAWTVTFSEPVTGVAAGNFALAVVGLGGAPAITGVVGSGTTWTVTASAGTGDGTLGLNFTSGVGITDAFDNVAVPPVTGPLVEFDRTAPSVLSVTPNFGTINDAATAFAFTLTVVFSEPMNTGVNPTLSFPVEDPAGALGSAVGVWADATTFVVTYAAFDTNVELADVDVQVAGGQDAVGNAHASTTFADVFDIDTLNPAVVTIARAGANPTNAASVSWTVTFSQAVFGLTAGNFSLVNGGLGGTPAITLVGGSGTTWTVTASTGTGDGALRLDLANSTGLGDAAGNAVIPSTFTGEAYTLDRTVPTALAAIPSVFVVSDAQAGGAFTLSVSFNDQMDPAFAPVLSFPTEDPAGTLSFTGGAWANALTYVASYSVADVGVELADIDVRVTGGRDIAGNTAATTTFVDVFDIDTLNPAVLSISRDGASPTNAASVSWTVTFSEPVTGVAAGSFTLVASGLGGTPAMTGVTGGGTTWTVTASTGTGDGTLRLDLTDATGLTDVAGNEVGNPPFVGATYALDRTAPTVTNLVAAPATVTDAAAGPGTFTIAVTFSEAMNTAVAPSITFPAENPSATLTFASGAWVTSQLYVATYDVADVDVELADVDVRVAGAADPADNAQATIDAADQFDIDTLNPTVVGITRDGPSPANAASVSWSVSFSEPVVGVVAGSFTLVSSGLGGTPAITGVTGAGTTWTVTASTGTGDGTLRLDFTDNTGIADAAGNPAGTTNFVGETYSLDRTAPAALSVTASPALITDAAVGAGTLSLTVVFSEPMNAAFAPTFSFPAENPGGTLSLASGSWISSATYVAVFDVTDLDADLRDIDVRVTDGRDLAGNAAGTADFPDTFSLDTKNPKPTVVMALDSSPTAASVVHWQVTFDEPVVGLTLASFSLFDTTGGALLTALSGSGTTYAVTASVPSVSGTVRLDVTAAAGATDAAGNPLEGLPFAGDAYTLDWTAPQVTSVVAKAAVLSDLNVGLGGWSIDVTFNEPMNTGAAPALAFPVENPAGTLSFASGSWINSTTYRAVYNVADVNTNLPAIDVRVTGGADLLGNVHGVTDTADVFSIDTANPFVVAIVANDPLVTNAQFVSWTVTFSEPVVGVTAANFLLFDGNLAPSIAGVTGAGDTWVVTADTGTGEGTLSLYVFSPLGLTDDSGNLIVGLPVSGPAYYVDHVAPTVPLVAPSDGTITVAQTGPNGFAVTIQFSEAMNPAAVPAVTFPAEDPGATLTPTGGAWLDGKTYRVHYTVANLGVELADIDIRVAGGKDIVGNTMAPQTLADVFDIDTRHPLVLTITRLDANPNTGAAVSWQVTFDEAISGLSAANFSLIAGGLGGTPAITGVTGSGTTWTVTASTGAGNGTLRLDLVNAAGVADIAGNPLANAPVTGPTYTIVQVAPPTVAAVQVNDGSPQRSMVTSFTVTFSETVSFPFGVGAAFQLVRTGPGGPTGAVNLVAVHSGATVTITFAAGGVVDIDPAGSLADGAYVLTVVADKVTGVGGTLDGNADLLDGDDFTTPAAGPGRLHRLFGDADGDGDVDAIDFGLFRTIFGTPSFAFDYDGDGDVDALDFGRFRLRFGMSV